MRNTLISITLLLLSFRMNAQVVYEDFELIQQNNVVLIHWTVKSGSLCNGTTVFRKTENGSDIQVDYIDGICGSEQLDVSYGSIDSDPALNATNTYYIQFGFGEYTEEKSIYVRYLEPERLYLSPNPANENVKIEWNDQFHETYTIRITNTYSQDISVETDVLGNTYQIPVEHYPSGLYFVQLLTGQGKQLQSRLVKM